MPAEATQEIGRRGVALVQRWLEATTFIELPWNVYDKPDMCQVEHLAGVKYFDLYGHFLGPNRREAYVENKNYSSDGGQYSQFQEFLTIAYSFTAKVLQTRADRGTEFIWVTSHPFGPLTRWSKLESEDELRVALKARPDLLGGATVDDTIVRLVASRVWVLVMNKKQIDLSLTQEEVWSVVAHLKRKQATL